MTLNLDCHKLNWHQDRVNDWLAGERIAPITIDCALTRSCTYKCEYCYSKTQYNKSKPLGEKTILDFLDDAADIGVKAVSFVSDGESTCSPHWLKALFHGKHNGLDVALGTNGYLITDEQLECALGLLTYIRFNISAATLGRYNEIHGTKHDEHFRVLTTIANAVAIKKRKKLPVTIGMQMVLLPKYADQIIPLANLAIKMKVDYLVIKHCSDDEKQSLSVDYTKYFAMSALLKKAEGMSTKKTQIAVKWSKIMSHGERNYSKCFGAQFIGQYSGSGLVAPCGMLFNEIHKKYHIGYLQDTRYKKIWQSNEYWRIMKLLHSKEFDPRTMCGSLCLQHKANEYLYALDSLRGEKGKQPQHINFV